MPANEMKAGSLEVSGARKIKASVPAAVQFEPAVVSFSRTYRATADGLTAGETGERLASVLTEVAASLREAGGFIGHIKALIALPEGGSLGLSVVRDRAGWKENSFDRRSPLSTFKASVTAIVYGCSKDELGRLMRLGLALGLPKGLYEEVPAIKTAVVSLKSILAARPDESRRAS